MADYKSKTSDDDQQKGRQASGSTQDATQAVRRDVILRILDEVRQDAAQLLAPGDGPSFYGKTDRYSRFSWYSKFD